MQLPASSYDANTHMFFAAHYASHWFNPWNEKWFGGFSQTTYPPLTHQWIALFSHLMGLKMAYMFVQFIAILLLPDRHVPLCRAVGGRSVGQLCGAGLGVPGIAVDAGVSVRTIADDRRGRAHAERDAVLLLLDRAG